jgi:hypothetical protein
MSEPRDIPSLWWLPHNPKQQWVGELRLAPKKGPRLRFTVPEGRYIRVPEIPEILHGCDQHGNPITLLHAHCVSKTMSGALAQLTCQAGYALLGLSISTPEEFRASSISLRAQHLFDWIGYSGFKDQEADRYECKIHHVLPDLLTFEVNPGMKVKIVSSSLSNSSLRERRVSEDAAITFESSSGFSIPECHELVAAVRHLLHFALLRKIFPICLTCKVKKPGIDTDDSAGHPIEFVSGANHREAKSAAYEHFLFQLSDVRSDFGGFFQKWLSFLRTFDDAVGCYSTTVYHTLPDTVEHLCLTQALEAYHGIKYQSIQQQDFAAKIRELVQLHQTSLSRLFPDATEFAATVRDNRNYFTHYNPKWRKDNRVVSRADLSRLNLKLKILMQACVLNELGIPSSAFAKLMRQMDVRFIEYM